jgi:hypothetical protein
LSVTGHHGHGLAIQLDLITFGYVPIRRAQYALTFL